MAKFRCPEKHTWKRRNMPHSHSGFTTHLERSLGPILAGSFTGRSLIPFPCLHANVCWTNLGPHPQSFDILPQWVFGDGGGAGFYRQCCCQQIAVPWSCSIYPYMLSHPNSPGHPGDPGLTGQLASLDCCIVFGIYFHMPMCHRCVEAWWL